MKIEFLIDGNEPSPRIGVVNGHIYEAVNQVTAIELFVVTESEMDEEDIEQQLQNRNATLKLTGTIDKSYYITRFDGIIWAVERQEDMRLGKKIFTYRLVIRPKTHKLSITNHSNAFPDKSRLDAIQEVLKSYQFADGIDFDLSACNADDYPKLPQLLQHECSDWDFIARLMREAGINYHFTSPEAGENQELLRLVDNSAYFKEIFPEKIEWDPPAGMGTDFYINSFDINLRSVPAVVNSTASLGDGKTKSYDGSADVNQGTTDSAYQIFNSEGETEQAAIQQAKRIAEQFDSERVKFKGKSNHFCIRPGERFTISSLTRLLEDKKILVTSVTHTFQQRIESALSLDTADTVHYSNTFMAVPKIAEYRPQTIRTISRPRTTIVRNQLLFDLISQLKLSLKAQLNVDFNFDLNLNLSPQIDVNFQNEFNQYVFDELTTLIESSNSYGVLIGTVIAAAGVTGGKEMVCTVKSSRYPKGIVAKVGTGWLVPGGGLTLFPRVGMEVYFVVVQSSHGNDQGVVLGYRPSGSVPALDPSATTETNKLEVGDTPEAEATFAGQTVTPATFSPKNYNRLAIRGEKGVSELAVIDGEAPSVSTYSKKDIYTYAGENHHIHSGKDNFHLVGGEFREQVAGNSTRGVGGNLIESIGGNRNIVVTGKNQVKVLSDSWFKYEGHKFEMVVSWKESIQIGTNNALFVGQESSTKLAASISNTFGASASTNYSTNIAMKKETTREICFQGKKLIVKKDKNDDLKGNWKVSVDKKWSLDAKSMKLKIENHAIFNQEKLMVKTAKTAGFKQEKFIVDSSDSSTIKGKGVTIDGKSDAVQIKSSKEVTAKASGNSVKIDAAGVTVKGKIIKAG